MTRDRKQNPQGNVGPHAMPFRLLREKLPEHQGTFHTVFFTWQCVEMALRVGPITKLVLHCLTANNWPELKSHEL